MQHKIGQVLVIGALSLLFLAYSNFIPTALQSNEIADYVKNHFVREVLFGLALTIWAIKLALSPKESFPFKQLLILGTIIISPFWIAYLFGWSTGGMEVVWGETISPNAAYALHGSQVVLFMIGMLLLKAK